MEKRIYLDNNSTTKIDPRVLEEMMPFLTDEYANAASSHEFGTSVNNAVKNARQKVSDLIGSEINEIIFTSGATEAINLAIKGAAEYYQNKGKHIITVQTEHKAVLDVCAYLESKNFEVTYLPVENDGLLNLNTLKNALRQNTILVSVMFVNNEIGVIQPIKEIADIVHNNGSIFMSDATQAVGKIPINVNELGIDLMPFSGHKFYGPKGIGGLFIRSKRPNKIKVSPVIHGGGHERGFRSGTLNVPGIIGLGKAAEIALEEMEEDSKRIREMRDYLEKELLKINDTSLNGNRERRIHNTSNIFIKGVDANALIIGLKNISISQGSACSTSKMEPSHVLVALGLKKDDSYSNIRISLGKYNSFEEINQFLNIMLIQVNFLRNIF